MSQSGEGTFRPATRIGVVGLGKVGLALALVLRHHGRHSVIGWDANPAAVGRAQTAPYEMHPEIEMRKLLAAGPIPLAPTLQAFVENADVIFIVVNTPHPGGYDGTKPVTHRIPVDFQYNQVEDAVKHLGPLVMGTDKTLILVSTVTPGHSRRILGPLGVPWAYSPVFISLGVVVSNLLRPEFLLAGTDDKHVRDQIEQIWRPVVNTVPTFLMSPESAELAKLGLNVAITQHIAWMNEMAILADHIGADIDELRRVLTWANKWRTPPSAGLGEGGACRPRDQVALDAVFLHANMPRSLAGDLIASRERHSAWHAYEIAKLANEQQLPVVVIGTSYKTGVPYTDGSPALLLANDLTQVGVEVRLAETTDPEPAIWVLGLPRQTLGDISRDSIIYDPWGECRDTDVLVYRPGRPPTRAFRTADR